MILLLVILILHSSSSVLSYYRCCSILLRTTLSASSSYFPSSSLRYPHYFLLLFIPIRLPKIPPFPWNVHPPICPPFLRNILRFTIYMGGSLLYNYNVYLNAESRFLEYRPQRNLWTDHNETSTILFKEIVTCYIYNILQLLSVIVALFNPAPPSEIVFCF